MSRICLYFRQIPDGDRWLLGDRYVRPLVRRIVRGKPRLGGIDKVFSNLCLGLDRLGIDYIVNLPFNKLKADDRVGVFGRGRYSLEGYDRPNPIVAGIGLMTHPSEWPTLCEEYPVMRYLQHSAWANEIYRLYFGGRCTVWPVGIDADKWAPNREKDVDFLIYDKVMWNRDVIEPTLIAKIHRSLSRLKLKVAQIRYGYYSELEYRDLLARSRAMIFLSEHESQGLAYQECLSCDVPILAWDQGWWLDPNRFAWGQPNISASSVPYFDERCGERFAGIDDFDEKLQLFLRRMARGAFSPRSYIMENLTLQGCAKHFIEILDETNS